MYFNYIKFEIQVLKCDKFSIENLNKIEIEEINNVYIIPIN
jgi:hypothetical protein